MSYRHRVARFRKMKDDKSLLRMTPDRAEDYGRRVYDMHGGRFAQQSPQVLDRRLEQMEKRYDDMEREFKERLADDGLMLDEHGVTARSRMILMMSKHWIFIIWVMTGRIMLWLVS